MRSATVATTVPVDAIEILSMVGKNSRRLFAASQAR